MMRKEKNIFAVLGTLTPQEKETQEVNRLVFSAVPEGAARYSTSISGRHRTARMHDCAGDVAAIEKHYSTFQTACADLLNRYI